MNLNDYVIGVNVGGEDLVPFAGECTACGSEQKLWLGEDDKWPVERFCLACWELVPFKRKEA